MKPRSPILFHLLTGITICWLAISTVRAETELPASSYSPRSGELTAREMTIAKNAWQYFVSNYQHDGAGKCGQQISLHHHVGQRILSGRHDRSARARDHR